MLFICFKDKYFCKNAGVILLSLKIYLKIFTIASTQHCSILWVVSFLEHFKGSFDGICDSSVLHLKTDARLNSLLYSASSFDSTLPEECCSFGLKEVRGTNWFGRFVTSAFFCRRTVIKPFQIQP